MPITRKPKRWKNKPINLDEGDLNADWLKQNKARQREDLAAHNTIEREHKKKEKK